MLGLKTQEGTKFERYFALIQSEAKKQNAIFYAYAGDGHEFETQTMEGENMMGWLIPYDKASEFEPLWYKNDVDDEWTDFFKWAVWSESAGKITIQFEE